MQTRGFVGLCACVSRASRLEGVFSSYLKTLPAQVRSSKRSRLQDGAGSVTEPPLSVNPPKPIVVHPSPVHQALAANSIVANAPLSVRASKGIINTVVNSSDEWDKDEMQKLIDACSNSDDHVEGRRAFMEKRTPKFKGV